MRHQHTTDKRKTQRDWLSEENRDKMRGNERWSRSDITEASWVKGGRLDHHLESYWGSGEEKLQKNTHTRRQCRRQTPRT